ncbi:S1C family serine protease [Azospirillum halopraeferens]|uniref:S1C family serine protease n=1 Tax=Azospirillum halopraeferens TaxID=34010 RepID=UPI0004062237|nr:trypsin-like peptidase domain-containing protein [Azospirillum halopraeferens]
MGRRIGVLLLIWALALATAFVGERLYRLYAAVTHEPRVVTPRGALAPFEEAAMAVFETAAPSVVYVYALRDPSGDPGQGTGSGIVWDAAGHVVTNLHVVEGADRVAVRLDSGLAVPAAVVGTAPQLDLAVLRLPDVPAPLRPIAVGTSEDLAVGQAVFAIGNPFGLGRSMSRGIVSALDRTLPTLAGREVAGVIQTDAAINPGNSGGPLLDSAGRLVGVNTAILSGTGAFAGVGFAVPVDLVNRAVPALIRDGRLPLAGLGVAVAPDEATARRGITGVMVAAVPDGSPAARAGLRGIDPAGDRPGDVVTHVGGRRVETLAQLTRALEAVGIGNEAELTVLRAGETVTLRVPVVDIS